MQEKLKSQGELGYIEYVYLNDLVYICNVNNANTLDFEVSDIEIKDDFDGELKYYNYGYNRQGNEERLNRLLSDIYEELKSVLGGSGASILPGTFRQRRNAILDLLAKRVQANRRRNTQRVKTLRRGPRDR